MIKYKLINQIKKPYPNSTVVWSNRFLEELSYGLASMNVDNDPAFQALKKQFDTQGIDLHDDEIAEKVIHYLQSQKLKNISLQVLKG